MIVITAYKGNNGRIYENEDDAIASDERLVEIDAFNVLAGKLPPTHWSEVDGWDCSTSPTKKCVYDFDEEPLDEICLFCHEPEERK
jgi:hypothetical protein